MAQDALGRPSLLSHRPCVRPIRRSKKSGTATHSANETTVDPPASRTPRDALGSPAGTMRRVAHVLGKTAVCAVARAAPAPLAPASRAAMAVAPVRLNPASLCTAGQPPRWVRSTGPSRSRRDRARVRADASAPGLLAARARPARLRAARRALDATRLERSAGVKSPPTGPLFAVRDPIGSSSATKRFPSAALTTYRTLPDFPNAKTRRRTTRARGVSPPSPVTTSPRWTSSTPRDWS